MLALFGICVAASRRCLDAMALLAGAKREWLDELV